MSSRDEEGPQATQEEMLAFLRDRGIKDPKVIAAMAQVPRDAFVPTEVRSRAYGRRPLSIGFGQTISTPFIVASMTELLDLDGTERLLEIGTGCGYQTAVLCEILKEVYSIEIVPEVAAMGASNLARLDYTPFLKVGDGASGWASEAPFDRILLSATSPRIPSSLLDQLNLGGLAVGPEQARPEGTAPDPEERREVLVKYRRTEDGFERSVVYGVRFVPMTGKVQEV